LTNYNRLVGVKLR